MSRCWRVRFGRVARTVVSSVSTACRITSKARSMRAIALAVAAFAVFAAPASADPAVWQRETRLPQIDVLPATASLNGRIYLIGGGHQTATDIGSRTVIAYNPTTARWTARAALPESRGGATAVTVNGHIYVIGGFGPADYPTDTVYMYHPKQNRWSVEPSAPVLAYTSPAVATTNAAGHPAILLFYGSGTTITTATKSYGAYWTLTYSYDTVTKRWTQLATSPEGLANGSAAGVINGLVYLNMLTRTTFTTDGSCRPAAHDNDTGAYQTCIWSYDPDADAWTPLIVGAPPFQEVRPGAVSADGNLVLFGEGPLTRTAPWDPRTVEVFDPAHNTWHYAPDTIAPHAQGAIVAMGSRIYAIGGLNAATWVPNRVVESINTTP